MKNISVCLVGPDGAGKSTLIESLCSQTPAKVFYFGYGASRAFFFSRWDWMARLPKANYFIRLMTSLDDFMLSLRIRMQRCPVIIDRFPSDNVINCVLDQRPTVNYHSWIFRFILKPSTFVLLSGDPVGINSRKPELSPERIERYIEEYRRFFVAKKVECIELSTTEQDIPTCTQVLKGILYGN